MSAYLVVLLIYAIVGLPSGYKFVSGKSAWLDSSEILNRVVKFLVCLFAGGIIALYNFGKFVFKLILRLI